MVLALSDLRKLLTYSPPVPKRTIGELQGVGHISPVVGERFEVEGVVTGVEKRGFYVQDDTGAIYVHTNEPPSVSSREQVRVEGTVAEHKRNDADLSVTQLDEPRVYRLAFDRPLPEAVPLPTPTGSLYEAGLLYEPFEAKRVFVPGGTVIGASNEYGDAYIMPDVPRLQQPACLGVLRGFAGATFPMRLKLTFDRALYGDGAPKLNVGDRVGPIEGNFVHGFGFYGVKATAPVDVTKGDMKPDITSLEPTEWGMTVASFNVENLDAHVENPENLKPGGRPDDDVADGRFAKIAQQIVENLKTPDIVALQEIQDNDGSEYTKCTDASKTWQTLIDAIVAAGGPRYEWVDRPPKRGSEGGQPGGNIRVGYLYNPKRVELDEASVMRVGVDEPAFDGGRKPLSAAFKFKPTGQVLHTVNNHWASKHRSTPTYRNPNLPEKIGGVEERAAQQVVVEDHVRALLSTNARARVLSVGDFNAPEYEDPIRRAGSGLLHNLGDLVDDADRWSYVFQGLAEPIDHQFASESLKGKCEFEYVHVNAGFADQSSDHDPCISRIDMR